MRAVLPLTVGVIAGVVWVVNRSISLIGEPIPGTKTEMSVQLCRWITHGGIVVAITAVGVFLVTRQRASRLR